MADRGVRRRRAVLRQIRRNELAGLERRDPAAAPAPMLVHRVPTGGDLLAIEGVGLAVSDPAAVAAFLCAHLGMHELRRTPTRVVVGAGDGAATLTLAAADDRTAPGGRGRVVLRVADLQRAVRALPPGIAVDSDEIETATFAGPEGIGLGFTLVAGGGIDYDVDHLLLSVAEPEETWRALAQAGFVTRARALQVADKYVIVDGGGVDGAPSCIDHIAVRVASLEAVAAAARQAGLAFDEPGSRGAVVVVLPGREQIRLHFVDSTPRD